MTLNKIDVRRQMYALQQHHTNILKKVEKMKLKCDIVGVTLKKEINIVTEAMTLLLQVLYQSAKDMNEDMQYYYEKLQTIKEAKEATREYARELNQLTIDINNSNKNNKNYDEATLIDSSVKKLDKMVSALNNSSSILSSSREERKTEAIQLIRNINSNILKIKTKILKKTPIGSTIRKPPFIGKKLPDKKKF